MKNLLLCAVAMLGLALSAQGQAVSYVYQTPVTIFSATGTGGGFRIVTTGAAFHQLVWNIVGGTLSACQVQVDSSADGSSWTAGGVIATTLCTSNGTALSASTVVNYVRINVTSLTGSGSLSTILSGFLNNPTTGGSGTVNNCLTVGGNAYYAATGTTASCDGGVLDNGAGMLTATTVREAVNGGIMIQSTGGNSGWGFVNNNISFWQVSGGIDFELSNTGGPAVYLATNVTNAGLGFGSASTHSINTGWWSPSVGTLLAGNGTGSTNALQVQNEVAIGLIATSAITASVPVKIDTANANQVIQTVTTDTGPGIAVGVAVNSPLAAQNTYVVTSGVVSLTLGTGTCAIGNFVIVDTTTAGRIKCTGTYTAGTVIGVAMAAQVTVGSTLNVMVGLR